MLKKIFLPLLLGVFFCCSGAAAADLEEIGQPRLASLINQNAGKVIMLNFFATWCPPCGEEIPELAKLRDAFPPEKLEIIGLSVDEDKTPLPAFLKDTGVNYPVYLAGDDVTSSYQISSVPHNVFYSPKGEMVISEPGIAQLDLLKTIVEDLLKTAPAK